jgi:hypothetical protein
MSYITLHMRDGSVKEFKHQGRHGGSYTKTLKYEPGFVVITDEWGLKTSVPADLIERVEESPTRW